MSDLMKALGMIGAFFLSIILFMTISGTLLIFTVNQIVTADNIKEIIREVGIGVVDDELAQDLLSGEMTEEQKELYDLVQSVPEFKEILVELLEDIVDYFIDEGTLPQITDGQINRVMESSYVQEGLGNNDKEEVRQFMEEFAREVNENFEEHMGEIDFTDFVSEMPSEMRIFFSPDIKTNLLIFIGIIIILMGLCLWSYWRPLIYAGIPAVLAGGMFALSTSVVRTIFAEEMADVVGTSVIDSVVKIMSNYGYIVLGIGAAMIGTYILIKKRIAEDNPDRDLKEKLEEF